MKTTILILGTGSIATGVMHELITSALLHPAREYSVYVYSQSPERTRGFILDLEDCVTLKKLIDRHKFQITFKSAHALQGNEKLDYIVNCLGILLKEGEIRSRESLYQDHCNLLRQVPFLEKLNLQEVTVINVSNPVDEINAFLASEFKISKSKIFGIGLSHDYARLVNETGNEDLELAGNHGEDIEVTQKGEKLNVSYEQRSRGLRILKLKQGVPPVFAPVASIMSILTSLIDKRDLTSYASVWCPEKALFTGKKIRLAYYVQEVVYER